MRLRDLCNCGGKNGVSVVDGFIRSALPGRTVVEAVFLSDAVMFCGPGTVDQTLSSMPFVGAKTADLWRASPERLGGSPSRCVVEDPPVSFLASCVAISLILPPASEVLRCKAGGLSTNVVENKEV